MDWIVAPQSSYIEAFTSIVMYLEMGSWEVIRFAWAQDGRALGWERAVSLEAEPPERSPSLSAHEDTGRRRLSTSRKENPLQGLTRLAPCSWISSL